VSVAPGGGAQRPLWIGEAEREGEAAVVVADLDEEEVPAGAQLQVEAVGIHREGIARPQLPFVDEFRLRSECVSEFWGKDRYLEAGVVRPLDWKEGEELPVALNVHGFGGSHEVAWRAGPQLQKAMQTGAAPRMLYVFLNAQFEWGHHEFADSRCNGPWGKALTQELIPALEEQFGAVGEQRARFVTGHSSGGWSSLWLQVTYPDVFGGCWSTAPDPVDFRGFTGVDIYGFESAFVDPEGEPIMLRA
jgi:dipeptidyl aminopeptidase/acylaminoacyl peptidase